jgi:hypothetical protein
MPGRGKLKTAWKTEAGTRQCGPRGVVWELVPLPPFSQLPTSLHKTASAMPWEAMELKWRGMEQV